MLASLVVPLLLSVSALFRDGAREVFWRRALGLALLPHEAWIASDAIARTLLRVLVTRKHLLQWVTAAAAARAFADGSRAMYWRQMGPAALVPALLGAWLGWTRPWALPYTLPILALWLVSPEIARWVSAPTRKNKPLPVGQRTTLRRLARRTWLFFETFVGPADQWLAPDNFQVDPGGVVAHRTSPTNVGLMLVAELSAYDLGYIGRSELAALVRHSLDTLDRLERYHGHWLNWYNTRTLEPLLPRYVSTVDSGNLAAAMITLSIGCRQAALAPRLRPVRFEGLIDTLDLLEESLERVAAPHRDITSLIARLRASLLEARSTTEGGGEGHALSTGDIDELERGLLGLLDQTTSRDDVAAFRDVQTWLDCLRHQVRSIESDRDPQGSEDAVRGDLLLLSKRLDEARASIDFRFLFDPARKLFHIGYNATADKLDANYYDLLASEARLASFLAVVESQVPPEHWFTLGRPVTQIRGEAALVSWGGTMFEYLMPTLFVRSQARTLLERSSELAVRAQIDYGRRCGLPWGVSESGFAQLDTQRNYQYRSFGVPGLGLRRGLEEDRVVAPYACVLALPFEPEAVIDNLAALDKLGAMGLYGLFEAIDFDQDRVLEAATATGESGRYHAVVRSHMAHHQGMVLAALNNALNDDVLVERFHDDALVKTGEPLLSERLPSLHVVDDSAEPAKPSPEVRETSRALPSWAPEREGRDVALLGNGRLTTTLTDAGAGFTSWNGVAITRPGLDPTCDSIGTWIYLRDDARDRTWSATPAPVRPRATTDEVVFDAHQVAFHHRDEGISIRTEVAVSAVDDVEVRRIMLHNESDQHRTLTVFTFSEPALESAAASRQQPAFSRLFVECESLPEHHGVLASRRTRNPDDPTAVMVQSLVWDDDAVTWAGSETDRRTFVGRRNDARTAKCSIRGVGATTSHVATLDPAIALAVRVELTPRARIDVALVTAVAKTRDGALDLARRFGSLHAVRWVAHDARRDLLRRLERDGMTAELFPPAMRLVSRVLSRAPTLVGPRPALSATQASKSGLWGHGISGDDPLIVVRVRSLGQQALVEEVLAAYRFMRSAGGGIELVFLDDASTSYNADEPGSIRDILRSARADIWLNQKGGIFVVPSDRLTEDDRALISQAARVLIDSDKGSLAQQVARPAAVLPVLPAFVATRHPELPPTTQRELPVLLFETAYGGFSEDGREYVVKAEVTRPVPAPWCNVLANAEAGCLVSESSLGATWWATAVRTD